MMRVLMRFWVVSAFILSGLNLAWASEGEKASNSPVEHLTVSVTEHSDGQAEPIDNASVADVDPYIKNNPKDRAFRIMVMGDSLGVGAWQGLYQNFKDDFTQKVEVIKKAQVNTGIVRADRLNWPKKIKSLSAKKDFEIAVLMFGGNDMQTIRLRGKAHHYKTDGWVENYKKRIDDMIGPLKESGVAIYWMGLPIVSKKRLAEDYLYINAIFKEKAEEHGIRYAETWEITSDENGKYAQYGPDLAGKKTKLRARDGVHFTPPGYRKLAHPVEEMIRSDLAAIGVVTRQELSEEVPLPRAKDDNKSDS